MNPTNQGKTPEQCVKITDDFRQAICKAVDDLKKAMDLDIHREYEALAAILPGIIIHALDNHYPHGMDIDQFTRFLRAMRK